MNDEAKRLAEDGAPEGTVVVAAEQRHGRGRRGRGWTSPPGNLYSSFLLRPKAAPTALSQLSFVAAIAVGEALLTVERALPIAYKWPNDVLLDGRKVCGILLETSGPPMWVVMGIGLNLVSHPDDTERPATSLARAGLQVDPDTALAALARALENTYRRWCEHGFDPVRQAWLARAVGLGEPIAVRLADRELHGRFAAMAPDGALLLEQADGSRLRIDSGDVFLAAGQA
jgi:BirA family biotin operon repressor/biotin-[acetyl-CoA-carboxylase] ligase